MVTSFWRSLPTRRSFWLCVTGVRERTNRPERFRQFQHRSRTESRAARRIVKFRQVASIARLGADAPHSRILETKRSETNITDSLGNGVHACFIDSELRRSRTRSSMSDDGERWADPTERQFDCPSLPAVIAAGLGGSAMPTTPHFLPALAFAQAPGPATARRRRSLSGKSKSQSRTRAGTPASGISARFSGIAEA